MHITPEIAEQFKYMAKINRLTQSELLQILLVYAKNLKISVGDPITSINLELNQGTRQVRTVERIRKLMM